MSNKYFIKAVNIVNKKGGSLISTEKDYLNAHSKLEIKCNEKHNFHITLSNLNLNRWCPHCSSRKMERYTKELIQTITNKKFIKLQHPSRCYHTFGALLGKFRGLFGHEGPQ
jgi:hypothetical protein